jgi:integrase
MMSSTKNNSSRTSKGSVAILSSNGRLQLRFNYGDKRHYLSLGLPDTKANRKAAELKVQIIERDIAYGEVDLTLRKYKPQNGLEDFVPVEKLEPDLRELWEKWVDYRRPQLEAKTLDWFSTMSNHINRMPVHTLDQSQQIRDWVVSKIAADMGKRLLTRINACCKWALKNGLIAQNPFEGMAAEIKLTKAQNADNFDIDPFTREEQEAIIDTFEKHRYHKIYAPLVRFLLLTGCRPSEALGLRWRHVDDNKILFKEAVVYANSRPTEKKSTKTGQDRFFPINKTLRLFLDSIQPENARAEDFLFSINGKPMNYSLFWRAWHGRKSGKKRYVGIVMNLAEKGLIKRYRHPYQCRHTFITQCLEAGVPVPQVAKWVGNSSTIIMQHYAGILSSVQVPEF